MASETARCAETASALRSVQLKVEEKRSAKAVISSRVELRAALFVSEAIQYTPLPASSTPGSPMLKSNFFPMVRRRLMSDQVNGRCSLVRNNARCQTLQSIKSTEWILFCSRRDSFEYGMDF